MPQPPPLTAPPAGPNRPPIAPPMRTARTAAQKLRLRRRGEGKQGSDSGTREKMMKFHGRSPLEAAAHPRPSKRTTTAAAEFFPKRPTIFRLTYSLDAGRGEGRLAPTRP